MCQYHLLKKTVNQDGANGKQQGWHGFCTLGTMPRMDKPKPPKPPPKPSRKTNRKPVQYPTDWLDLAWDMANDRKQPVLWFLLELIAKQADAEKRSRPRLPWEDPSAAP